MARFQTERKEMTDGKVTRLLRMRSAVVLKLETRAVEKTSEESLQHLRCTEVLKTRKPQPGRPRDSQLRAEIAMRVAHNDQAGAQEAEEGAG